MWKRQRKTEKGDESFKIRFESSSPMVSLVFVKFAVCNTNLPCPIYRE